MLKVLIVDDDQDLLEMVTLMLRAHQMEVTSLAAGSQLFESLSQTAPDVLVMDIFLGDTDGRQLCRQLKQSPVYTGFPVFLYSAGDVSPASISESHADAFLRKPFEMVQLVSQIRHSVKKTG